MEIVHKRIKQEREEKEMGIYQDYQYKMMKSAWDKQVERFVNIYKKEVVDRKRTTRRGVIANEVLHKISEYLFKDLRPKFEECYEQKRYYDGWRVVNDLERRLNGYKDEIRRGQLSWYGRLG